MRDLASGWDTVNSVIDSRDVLGALLVAAVTAVSGLAWRGWRQLRRVTWTVPYDETINQGADLWEITSHGQSIEHGSLVLIEVRSTGSQDIEEGHFAVPLSFLFAGRRVVDYKVRDSPGLHDIIKRHRDAAPPVSDDSKIELPPLPLNRGTGFKLLVLLTGDSGAIEAGGVVRGGRIARHDRLARRYRLAVVAVAVLALVAGTTAGVRLANRALSPTAQCATGTLTVEGSSAFAPIADQVRNSFQQSCPEADITIVADGSENGVAALEQHPSATAVAMSDGLPAPGTDTDGLVRRPVGVVIFAVVANTALRATDPDLFGKEGISADDLRAAFAASGKRGVGGLVAVGRARSSGTRATFAGAFFGGADPESAAARPCPVADGRAGSQGFCTEDTTMDLLSYVNSTPNAVGYAEADALPYFPDVQLVAVDGQLPTTQAVRAGDYPFVATEYLYTDGAPVGLTDDFLQFLTSDAVTATLRGHAYLACSDLAGSALDGACAG